MMNATQVMEYVSDQGVYLYIDDGQLKFKAKKGTMTPDLKKVIGQYKSEIINLLKENEGDVFQEDVMIEKRAAEIAPLSYSQQRLWFIDKLGEGSAQYNICQALEVHGAFDLAAAEQALSQIVERHEVLRTVFAESESGAVQRIQAALPFCLEQQDLSALDAEAQDARIQDRLAQEAAKRFDLASDLMVRAAYLRLSDQRGIIVFTVHHIAADGWSMGVLVKEFVALYQAAQAGEPSPLTPLAIQYADYAAWQRDHLAGEGYERHLAYWQEQLADAPVTHGLALDRPRPAAKGYDGAKVVGRLSLAERQRLEQLARSHDMTLFMLVHAALSLVLARHSGNADIVIGTPVANRLRAELSPLIGFFVNTLALRTQVNTAQYPQISDYLAHVREVNLAAQLHQDIPFEHVVEHCRVPRSAQHTPVFQILLTMNNNETGELALPGLSFSARHSDKVAAKFDLELNAQVSEEGMSLLWIYDSGLFDALTVERLQAHLHQVLKSLAQSVASEPLSGVTMLLQEETHRLVHTFNETEQAFPHEALIHHFFEAQAAKTPEASAVVFEDQSLSYAELDRLANQVAHYLGEQGVGVESLVGLYVERSLDMVVGLLGTLKAGAAYVPLDPSYPQARLDYMISDAQLSVVLSQASLPDLSNHHRGVRFEALDQLGDRLATYPQTKPDIAGLSAANLAYVIYTSGSTGQPKGVLVEHRALVNRLDWMQNQYQLQACDRVLQKTPFSFDVSVWEFCWTLSAGATLVMAKPEGHRDPRYLRQLMEREAVSVLHFVPSMLSAYLQVEDLAKSVRLVVCSGEALSQDSVLRVREQAPHVALHNLYGPTEAAIDVTAYDCAGYHTGLSSVPIGRAIQNIRLYVLDEDRRLCPQGAIGELYIGGVGLARGYLNQPALTAERFIEQGVAGLAPQRLYRTGDLVRYLADGSLVYLGRTDGQVKLRGNRIELGEIEQQLLADEAVRSAAVAVKATEANAGESEGHLVAYVVRASGDRASEEEGRSWTAALKERLQAVLPAYMVPSVYVALEALPLTASGKLDRKALPSPEFEDGDTYVAPRDERERLLCRIWSALLNIEEGKVGIYDNFFNLGGHSLLIIQVISRLQKEGYCTTLSDVFNANNLSDLASKLVNTDDIYRAPKNKIPPQCETITPDMLALAELNEEQIEYIVNKIPGGAKNIQDIYPLAPLQEGIYFHHRMSEPGHDPYVLAQLLSFNSREQANKFLSALQTVIDRHDVLRTAIITENLDTPVQVVNRKASLTIDTVEFENDKNVETQMLELAQIGRLHIDLSVAPPVSATIANDTKNDRYYALLKMHHIHMDHVALEVVVKEVNDILQGKAETLPVPNPYREFVAHARHLNANEDGKTFFTKKLEGIVAPISPFGLSNIRGDGEAVGEENRKLSDKLTTRLRSAAKSNGVSVASIFHSAWAFVLGACSGEEDIVFGTVLSGRLQGTLGAENSVGLFMNTLPLRIDIRDSAADVVRNTHRNLNTLLSYEQTPLSQVLACSSVPNDLPLFSAVINYRYVESAKDAKTSSTKRHYLLERTNYPFTLSVSDTMEELSLTTKVSTPADASRINDYLINILDILAGALEDDAEVAVTASMLLPKEEIHRQIYEWNSDLNAVQGALVHREFEKQVKENPDQIALIFEEENYTYQELNNKANQLARYLISQGVKPNMLVGISLPRSAELIISMMAILKAGGAYLPLDPEYPSERLSYLAEDSNVSTIITQSYLEAKLPFKQQFILCLDRVETDLHEFSIENLTEELVQQTPDDMAYVIYTSGSTGKPKGVVVNHRSAAEKISNVAEYYGLSRNDRSLLFASVNFDASVTQIFMPLYVGGGVVICPNDFQEPEEVLEYICEHEVSILHVVPQYLTILVEDKENLLPLWKRSKLRHVVSGGDVISHNIMALWRDLGLNDKICLYNSYGPTETTVTASIEYCNANLDDELPTIGRPLKNTQFYVVDKHSQLVPQGVIGELLIGGTGVTEGYLNRPELTREKFVENPFSTSHGKSLLYRTGDLVRYREDGKLEFCGRRDSQIKLRGFRIELGEIEHHLGKCKGVSRAAVVVNQSATGENEIRAYLVLDKVVESFDHIAGELAEFLPTYMLPAKYINVDVMPLTPSGKIDRKALLLSSDEKHTNEKLPPKTDTEQSLLEIWRNLLDFEEIGVDENFFKLGGHSLLATRLASQIRAEFEIDFTLKSLFEAPSIEEQASIINFLVNSKPVQANEHDSSIVEELTI